ncbi:MAG: hypothetical protein FWF41_04660 [Betaproteobacteria bacterium]|nr:hypothetical protein [Betaproteobacteria bacterium]
MKALIALLLLLLPALGNAVIISVGDTDIDIPAPPGYVAVTPEMKALYEAQKLFVPPTNVEFISFIPETDASSALRGEISGLNRTFSVQTSKNAVNVSASNHDFLKLKNALKTQNDEAFKKIECQIPDFMKKINSGVSRKYDVDLALTVAQMVPLPVHDEADRSIAYSAFIKYGFNNPSGKASAETTAATIAFVHIKGKILFLYSFGEENDIEWSRNASKQWSTAVISANPGNSLTLINEATGFNWGEIAANGIRGAIWGLIVYAIMVLIKRRRKR